MATPSAVVSAWLLKGHGYNKVYMECPICYDECHKTCKLVCGHSLCMSCVREWWKKSEEPTCPMCRNNLYFRGMRHTVSRWGDEYEDPDTVELWDDMCTYLLYIQRQFNIPSVALQDPWDITYEPLVDVVTYWDTPSPYNIVPRNQFRRSALRCPSYQANLQMIH